MSNFYKKSRNFLFSAYLLIFLTVMLLDIIIRPEESFMENKGIMGTLGILMFLLGSHFLYFKKLLVNDITSYYEKHLQGKPGWYQKWLSIHKSPKYGTIMTSIIGVFFIIFGLLMLFKVF